MKMSTSNWQREDVTLHYLEEVRGGIPFGAEQVRIMLKLLQHFKCEVKSLLDLGCGNGFLAETVLKSYPQASAVLLDHSKPMIEQAYAHMKSYENRCEIIHGDFSEALSNYVKPNSIDFIVSGYAIHHLSNEKKKKVYKDIYNILAPGGLFINIEHTASSTPKIEELYDELFIDHLSSYSKKRREEVSKDYYSRPDKEDNILERVDVQVSWLKEIGFDHVDCYFKWMELAVFGGVKQK